MNNKSNLNLGLFHRASKIYNEFNDKSFFNIGRRQINSAKKVAQTRFSN